MSTRTSYLAIDVRYGIREPNRLPDADKPVRWVARIGPPVSELPASEICARLSSSRASGWAVIDGLLSATYLIEVPLRIMVNDELCILILGSSRQARCMRTSGMSAFKFRGEMPF